MSRHRVLADEASFIMRLWLEPGGGDSPDWRWHVRHVQSGQQGYFSSLPDVLKFVGDATHVPPPTYGAHATAGGGPAEQVTRETVVRFLEQHAAMTVATADPQGVPWATPVFYVNDGLCLYWLSNPRNRLSTCLAANPRAVATIIGPGPEWSLMQGLQIEGKVSMVRAWREYFRCARLFIRKFPDFSHQFLPSTAVQRVRDVGQRRFYALESERLWFTDHTQGFGARVELDCRAAAGETEARPVAQ